MQSAQSVFIKVLNSLYWLQEHDLFPQDLCLDYCYKRADDDPDTQEYATIVTGGLYSSGKTWSVGEANRFFGSKAFCEGIAKWSKEKLLGVMLRGLVFEFLGRLLETLPEDWAKKGSIADYLNEDCTDELDDDLWELLIPQKVALLFSRVPFFKKLKADFWSKLMQCKATVGEMNELFTMRILLDTRNMTSQQFKDSRTPMNLKTHVEVDIVVYK